jgi:hypothetical protein
MRSILIKDFLEHRLNFIIILTVAIVSLLGAAWFEVLDPDVAKLLLFVFQAPLFVLLLANHSISSEVNNKTFPFLASLPVTRTRIWFTKLLFLVLFTVIIYFLFSVLWLIAGGELSALLQLIQNRPALTILLPFVVLSFGYFSSMLPQGFGFIAGIIILLPAAAIWLNEYASALVNYELLASLLILAFLALSAVVFGIDRKMTSIWRGVKGLGLLIAALVLLTFIWSFIDLMVEKTSFNNPYLESNFLLMENGNRIFFNRSYTAPAWDVIKNNKSSYEDRIHRIFKYDIKAQKTTQVGKRNHIVSALTDKLAIIEKPETFAGFVTKMSHVVIDCEGNELLKLSDNLDFGYYQNPIFVINSRSFIYSETIDSGDNKVIDFYLFKEETGLKNVFSADANQFHFFDFIKIPASEPQKKPQVYIIGKSKQDANNLTFISVPEKKKLLLPDPRGIIVTAIPNGLIYNRRINLNDRNDKSRELVKLELDGTLTVMKNISPQTEFCGLTSTGKLIAMTPADKQPHYVGPYDSAVYFSSLIAIDLETNNQIEICKFEPETPYYFEMHPSKEKGILYSAKYKNGSSIRKNRIFDSETLTLEDMPELDGISLVQTWYKPARSTLPDNSYIFLYDKKLRKIDLAKKELTYIADLSQVLMPEVSK